MYRVKKQQHHQIAKRSRSPAGPRRLRNSDAHERIAVPKAFCVLRERLRPRPKSGKVCRSDTRPGDVCERAERSEGSDTTPHIEAPKKCKTGVFIISPQQGSRRNPAKRFRWEEDERQRARVLPLAAGRGIRRPLGRRPASHLSGLRRSRCPAKCTWRGMAPHPQAAGRSPHPLLATIGEKHEKRYQIQHAHGVRRP